MIGALDSITSASRNLTMSETGLAARFDGALNDVSATDTRDKQVQHPGGHHGNGQANGHDRDHDNGKLRTQEVLVAIEVSQQIAQNASFMAANVGDYDRTVKPTEMTNAIAAMREPSHPEESNTASGQGRQSGATLPGYES